MKTTFKPVYVLLLVYAFAWPWDVYLWVPVLQINLLTLFAYGLIGVFLLDLLVRRSIRVPFELAWPPLLLAVLLFPLIAASRMQFPDQLVSKVVLCIAVVHVATGPRFAMHCLAATAAGCASLAAYSWVAHSLGIYPAAYSINSGLQLYGAHDIPGGLWAMTVGGIAAGWWAWYGRRRTPQLIAALLAAGLCLSLLVDALLRFRIDDGFVWPGRVAFPEGVGAWAALLLGLWFVARIGAKLVVERIEKPSPGQMLLLSVIALSVAFFLCGPFTPRFHHALLLGLAGAAGKRKEEAPPVWRPAVFCMVPLVLCLGVYGSVHVWPRHVDDPRNYAAAARRDMSEGQYELALKRLDYFQAELPNERRTYLWQIHAQLSQSKQDKARIHRAATALEAALEPPPPGSKLLLPAPARSELQDAFVRFRDAFSSPEFKDDFLGYERVFVAMGQKANALQVLKQRAERAEILLTPFHRALQLPRDGLASAIANLLGEQKLADELNGWETTQLLAVLVSCNAGVENLPVGFEEPGPVIITAHSKASALHVWGWQAGKDVEAVIPMEFTVGAAYHLLAGGWQPVNGMGGPCRVAFSVSNNTKTIEIAETVLGGPQRLEVQKTGGASAAVKVADVVLVRILVSSQ